MKTPNLMPNLVELHKRFCYNQKSGIVTHIQNCKFGKHLRGQTVGHLDN